MVQAFEAGGPVKETEGFRVNASTSEVSGLADIGSGQALAIIELGTNDVGRTSIESFTVDYRSMLSAIRKSSPDVQFVCAGVWHAPDLGRNYDAVIAEQCEAQHGAFRPLSDLHVQDRYRGPAGRTGVLGGTSDDFHPNDAGYTAVAQRLLSAVTVK
jgi:acyl-CoA thioesterase-1